MSLDAYKLPAVLRDGFVHALKDAPEVKFRISPPISANRKFQMTVLRRLPAGIDLQNADMLQVLETQREVFVEMCILSWEGVDKDFNQENAKAFFEEYPFALDEVWGAAQSYSETQETEVEQETGKLKKP
jgi:hypothetical protein